MRNITTHLNPATGLRGIADTSWQTRGECAGLDQEVADALYFPGPRDHAAIAEAKGMCSLCPVERDCLNYALENALKEGVWGGLTEAERRPWHEGLPHRLDYARISAFFAGRDVHLTAAERSVVINHSYARGWRADRLATALKITVKHARDLLRDAEIALHDRDLNLGIPPNPYKQKGKKAAAKRPSAPTTSRPRQQATRPLTTTSANTPLGKAA